MPTTMAVCVENGIKEHPAMFKKTFQNTRNDYLQYVTTVFRRNNISNLHLKIIFKGVFPKNIVGKSVFL